MLNHKQIIEKVELLEAAANQVKEEATSLKKMLGVVSTVPTTPKGLSERDQVRLQSKSRRKYFKQ
jgi:hypothetical protein